MARGSKWCVRQMWPAEGDCTMELITDCGRGGYSYAAAERFAQRIRNNVGRSEHLDRCAYGRQEEIRRSVRVVSMVEVRRDEPRMGSVPRALRCPKVKGIPASAWKKCTRIEMEHLRGRGREAKRIARCIAAVHFEESGSRYCDELLKMERRLRRK
jgi:hypothetical protein